jgi:hypothetical protein
MAPLAGSGAEPWDQQLGEPDGWYGRFFLYYHLPPDERSMLKVYEKVGRKRSRPGTPAHAVPHRWRVAKKHWRWVERAAAWDKAQRDQMRVEFEADRQAARVERIAVLKAGLERLEATIPKLVSSTASWNDITNAIRVICQEFRAEEAILAPGKGQEQDDWDDLLNPESARTQLAALLDAAGAFRRESEPRKQTEA